MSKSVNVLSFFAFFAAFSFSYIAIAGGEETANPYAPKAKTIHGSSGLTLTKTKFSKLKGWQDDAQEEALAAFMRSCSKLSRLPESQKVGVGLLAADAKDWQKTCTEASLVPLDDHVGARVFFERMFEPYKLGMQGSTIGKITGYYEPLLRGSWTKKPGFEEPVYGPPADLVSGQTYPLTRADIDGGALVGKGLEKIWVNDPADLFFLHVQGSGRVLMDTGEVIALRFNGKNNQPYTAIGRVLVDQGALAAGAVSAPAIRSWLKDNASTGAAREVMQHNASYVFFDISREVDAGPVGAQNVPLTAERSLAVDTAYIPLSTPIFLQTRLPDSPYGRGETYHRLMVAQDKGSAITGAVRGDVFFGFGERAEDLAGHMDSEGEFVVFLPKTAARKLEGKKW